MKVRCRAFYGDLMRLDMDGDFNCRDKGEYIKIPTYYLVLKQETGETIEINRVFDVEIEVINAKPIDVEGIMQRISSFESSIINN